MSMQNLAIVFGPTLFGLHTSASGQGGVISDTTFQNMVRAFSLIVRQLVCFTHALRCLILPGDRDDSQPLYGYLYRRIRVSFCPPARAQRTPDSLSLPASDALISYDTHLCFSRMLWPWTLLLVQLLFHFLCDLQYVFAIFKRCTPRFPFRITIIIYSALRVVVVVIHEFGIGIVLVGGARGREQRGGYI